MPRCWLPRIFLSLVLALLMPRMAIGQVQVGAEYARDRSVWHFENRSAYDTAELVPHSFEQRYVLDNLWLAASVGYTAGLHWRTSVGATPVREAPATDYDTFYNPAGVVWVSGTTGNADVHSFRVTQEMRLAAAGGLTWSGGYRLRMDLADFLEGLRTDVRNGIEIARTIVTTCESTKAQTHEVFVAAAYRRALAGRWTLRGTGDVSPGSVNRLAIQLPDKYPGQTFVFRTTTLTAEARAEFVREAGRWPVAIALSAGHSWNYDAAQQVTRSHAGVAMSMGTTW